MERVADYRGSEPWQMRRLLSMSLWLGIGVWLGHFFGHAPAWGWALFLVAALLYAGLQYAKLPHRNAGLFVCFALGVALITAAYPAWADDPWVPEGEVQVSGTVTEIGEAREIYTPLLLEGVSLGGGKTPVSGRVWVLDMEQAHHFLAGQKVSFTGKLSAQDHAAFLGDFDDYSYGITENIRFVSCAEHLEWEDAEAAGETWQLKLRQWVFRTVFHNLPRRTAATTYALLTGDRSYLDSALLDAVRRAGVLHLLVVSGLHISLSAGGTYALLRHLRAPKWCAAPVSLAVMGFYVVLAGWTPSVIRAVIMWCVWMLGQLAGRRYDGPSSLAAAFSLSMLVDPMDLFRLGFQLSYAATGAISFLMPALAKAPTGHRFADGLLATLTVSFCACLGTLPFLMTGFGQVPLLAPLINVVAAPAAMVLLGLGVVLSLLGGWTPYAHGLGYLVGRAAEPLLNWVSARQFPVVYTAPPVLSIAVVFLLLLLLLSPKIMDLPRRPRAAVAGMAFIMALLLLSPVNAWCQYPQAATVLREKNGTSLAWRTQGKSYLLCAGDAQNAAAFARRAYGGRVEGLLVTGKEEPGGQLLAAFDGMHIGTLYVPAAWLETGDYVDLIAAARKKGMRVISIERLECPAKLSVRGEGAKATCRVRVLLGERIVDYVPYMGEQAYWQDEENADVVIAGFTGKKAVTALAQGTAGIFIGPTVEQTPPSVYNSEQSGSVALFPAGEGVRTLPYGTEG